MTGIILVDKPEGWTSHDVVAKLRGVLHERRIGHSGTLDPLATGLLVVFLGRATRAVEFAENDFKEYTAGVRFGIETDTQDITGTVLRKCDCSVTYDQLEHELATFRGDINQVPPMYSALKVNGQPMYKLARKGKTVERTARCLHIEKLEILSGENTDWVLKIRCSKGTYVRTLCNDIGAALGCGGAMTSLRRTAAGAFDIKYAHTLDEIISASGSGQADRLILPVDSLFSAYPRREISTDAEVKCRNGNRFRQNVPDGEYRVYSQTGEFLMLGKASNGMVSTVKSFFEV